MTVDRLREGLRFLLVLPRAVLGLASFTAPALRVLLHVSPRFIVKNF